MSLYHFSNFDESNNPQGNDYIVGYVADPSRGGPVEYRTTITKLISAFVGGSTQTVYPSSLSLGGPSWDTGGNFTSSGGIQAGGNISTAGNGSFNTVNGYAINLQHPTANDGINPTLFIGESVGGSLSGFNTTYDEFNNKYILATQFGSVPPISALTITQTGNVGINTVNPTTTLTVSGSISASGNISASNVSASAIISNSPNLAKAWVSFQPSNTSNILKTYGKCSRTVGSSTMTVIITSGHNLQTGMVMQIDITGNAADSGLYSVSAVDSNTFQYTSNGITAKASTTCYLSNVVNFTGYNVANIAYPAGGVYVINFITPMNNSNYAFFLNSEGAYTRISNPVYGIPKDKYQFGFVTLNGAGGPIDYANVYTVVYGY